MEELRRVFSELGISYGDDKERKYRRYMEELLEYNRSVNLTAITDEKEFIGKHYVDSLLCAGMEEFLRAGKVIDVGTGGGFPGVPLAIAFPEKRFTLIDSLNKRIKVINEICEKHGILNVTAVHGRAEDLARRDDMRERFDLCLSRAVADMKVLAEYCLPFVKPGGFLIAYKGSGCESETAAAARAIETLGGETDRIEKTRISGIPFDHRLVVIKKMKNTLSKFPRKAGTPSKEPII